MEVTKEDLNRVYDRIDGIQTDVTEIKVGIATIQTKLEGQKAARKPFVRAGFDLIKIAIVAIVTYFFARK